MMERKLNAVDSKAVIDRGVFKCMVQPTWIRNKTKFLMDTGCGHDLISQKKIEKHELETLVVPEPISFQTANGITDTDLIFELSDRILFRNRSLPNVLDGTPSVLSVGKRCLSQNCGFVWPSGRDPFMILRGSNKSIAHDDAEAAAIQDIFIRRLEASTTRAETAATAKAVPGEVDGEGEGGEHERPPDPDPREVPDEEVPV